MTTITPTRDDRAAIDKAVSLLLSFGDQASTGLGVSELARRAALSKSTAFRVLGMLERNGVVEKVDRSYRLGSRLHDLGTKVYSAEHEALREVLTPFLADLYEMTHETVHLASLHGTDVVYLAKLFGHRRVPSPSRVGGRVPAHCTAVGKVLLAYSPSAFDTVTAAPLRALTSRTLSDATVLAAQLVRIRQEGIAFDDQEAAPGLNCVAVAVFGSDGRPLAALSVSGPVATFDPRAQAAPLRRVARAASQALQRSGVGSTVRRQRAIA
ncbi:IclR family transcriptional regulator [Nocardioides sp. NPDC006273]|uniref:IclR family transcriptional regulator n=1 Tax=Nocardioides sp. NPDC006273 TaxID=3155598 RepID=UPI0033A42A85